ncbi:MAG TPA: DUF885 domain-containing protein [Pseudonocardia sp.]|nr:DUF885 domain-containing protein [Pseudonocardia sp.]
MRAAAAVREYVALAARLVELEPGTAAVTPGPWAVPGSPGAAEPAAGPVPAAELARAADRLLAGVADLSLAPARRRVLGGQVKALRCSARRLAGRPVGFVEEVAECFDVHVGPGDPDRYAEVHRELDDLLPGRGPLAERIAEHRRRDEVPAPLLGRAVRAVADALRECTRTVLPLPAREEVEVRIVDDAPWSGFSRYLGSGRSVVSVNAAARVRAGQLLSLVAHECYPGHHAATSRADVELVGRRGWAEHAVLLVASPQSLVAEGLADCALDAVVGPGWGRWGQEVLREAGVRTDGELTERVERITAELQHARLDAALLLHDRGTGEDAVRTHLRRWLLVDDARAGQMLRFLADPRWRAYTATYAAGQPLVHRWLHGGDTGPATRFAGLVDAPRTPSMLRQELSAVVRPDGGQPNVYRR